MQKGGAGVLEVTGPQRRRSRESAALGTIAHQERYTPETLTDGFAGRERTPNPDSAKKRAKVAATESWQSYKAWQADMVEETYDQETGRLLSLSIDMGNELLEEGTKTLASGLSTARKYSIEYFYRHHYGAPPQDAWDEYDGAMRLPTIIMKHLAMPHGSYPSVVKAMLDIYAAVEAEEMYDPSGRIKKGRGAKAKIDDLTPQAEVVYRAMESGMSLGNTLVIVNQWRRANLGPDSGISYGALQRFAANSTVLEMTKRETRKAGSEDKESGWAIGRHAFSSQLLRQFRKAKRIEAGGPDYVAVEDGADRAQADLERLVGRRGLRCTHAAAPGSQPGGARRAGPRS